MIHEPLQRRRYLKAAKAIHRAATATDAKVERSWDNLSDDDRDAVMRAGRAAVDLWDALNMEISDG